jgi:hypothetical protein
MVRTISKPTGLTSYANGSKRFQNKSVSVCHGRPLASIHKAVKRRAGATGIQSHRFQGGQRPTRGRTASSILRPDRAESGGVTLAPLAREFLISGGRHLECRLHCNHLRGSVRSPNKLDSSQWMISTSPIPIWSAGPAPANGATIGASGPSDTFVTCNRAAQAGVLTPTTFTSGSKKPEAALKRPGFMRKKPAGGSPAHVARLCPCQAGPARHGGGPSPNMTGNPIPIAPG